MRDDPLVFERKGILGPTTTLRVGSNGILSLREIAYAETARALSNGSGPACTVR